MNNVMGGGQVTRFSPRSGGIPHPTHTCAGWDSSKNIAELWVNYSLGEKAAEAGLLGGELTPRLSWGNSRIPTEAGVRRDSPL